MLSLVLIFQIYINYKLQKIKQIFFQQSKHLLNIVITMHKRATPLKAFYNQGFTNSAQEKIKGTFALYQRTQL